MRKNVHTGRKIGFLSFMMAALMAFMQPCSVLAAEMDGLAAEDELSSEEDLPEEEETPEADGTVKEIVAFEELAEEETYYPCMYKPMLEELLSVFPEMLLVWLEDEESPVEIAVTWECEEDYDGSSQSTYYFYPKWDESLYMLSEAWEGSIQVPVITIEVPQEGGSIKNPEEAKSSLQSIVQSKAVLASIYLCDTYEIKAGPSSESETVQTVVSGQSVQITGVESDGYGMVWYQVLLYRNGTAYTGYVEKTYLVSSDESFTKWEETYLDLSAMPTTMDFSEGCPDIDQFPASYQNALYALKEKHPDWTFVRMNTGLDWNTAIASEMGDKSWISSNRSGSWQNGSTGQKGWSYASEGILKYYMDPRNFLAEPYIFQFEQLVYNSSYHTVDAVQGMLNESFMASAIPDDGRTYAQVFTSIGQELGVSPFHLASRVLQEQGPKGTSSLISGVSPGYEGYYNFFNVGASGTTIEEVIANGLKRAVKEGWNSRYASLRGGAYIIGNQYILCEQDTLYLEKFNVASGKYPNYTHQYMQNIEAPYAESSKIHRAYSKAGVLERKFVFKIPVYENMPASACAQPEKTDSLTLNKTTISSLEVDKSVTLIPYVNGSKVDHVSDMTFTSSNTEVAVVDAQGKVTAVSPGDATISCSRSGANSANCTVTVVKGKPAVSTPVLSPVTYREGLKLSDVILPAGWAWADGSISLEVGTPSYEAVYTPTDTIKYNTLTKNISFTVTKAIPPCQVPDGLEVKIGEKLGNIMLPEGFWWESDADTVLGDAGEYIFYVSYNPDDNNYYTVSHIPIIVQVKETITEPPSGGNTSGGGTTGSGNGGTGSGSGSGTTGGGTSGSGNGGTGAGNGTTGGGTSGSGTGNGSSTSSGSTSTGSTGNGGTQPPTSSGSTSNGSTGNGGTQPPASSGSASSGSTGNGGTQPPTSSGSTSSGSTGNGGTQPPTSSGSTSSGSTGNGGTQPSASSGSTSTGSTGSGGTQQPTLSGSENGGGAQSGNSSSDNAPSGNLPSNNTQSENRPEANKPSDNTEGQSGNQTSGGEVSGSTSGGNTQIITPGGNDETQESASDGNQNGGEEAGSPAADGAEGTESTGEMNHYRPAVTIQMEDTTILTPEKMQMAKEQNFDLLLDMGGAVTWSINVDSIDENRMTDVDMGVTLGTENIPQELISTILNGNKYLEVTLAHQGPFGFEPVLNIAIGKEYSGQYANLFYYDPEKESLEFICDAVIGPDGVASLRFEHASCYLVIVSEQSMSGVSFDDDSVNPLTRWIIIGVLICMILVVIGYGIFFFLKKKREEEEEEPEEDDLEYDEEDGLVYEELDDGEDDGLVYEELDDEEDDGLVYEELDEEEEDDDLEYKELDEEDDDLEYEEFDDDGEDDSLEYVEPDDEGGSSEYGELDDEEDDGLEYEEYEEEEGSSEYEEFEEERAGLKYGNHDKKEGFEHEESEEFEDNVEDDWIEDEEWQEPESDKKFTAGSADIINKRKKNDWPEEEEENAEDDWIEDEDWVE